MGLLSYSSCHYAFFRWKTVLRKGDTYLFCYADHHTAFTTHEEIDRDHSQAFCSLISSCKPGPYMFIVEDLSDYCGTNDYIKIYNKSCSSEGQVPLLGLAGMCRKRGLDVCNVEYRFVREIVIDSLLSNGLGISVSLEAGLSISNLIEETDRYIKTVEEFNDGATLNNFYRIHLDMVKESHESLLKLLTSSTSTSSDMNDLFEHSVSEFVEKNILPSKLLAFTIALRGYDIPLVDMIAIHKIVNTKDKKVIVLCMGAAHISQIVQALLMYGGYETCRVIGVEQEYPYKTYLFDNYSFENQNTIMAKIEEEKKKRYDFLTCNQLGFFNNEIF